ncbi:YopX family protein [Bacillus sp. NPDC094106]|uniref:YopX family protein n=1 Tax=Bacillus sp. NPDC094106 TaxID=3363949 RepID=UPI003824D407
MVDIEFRIWDELKKKMWQPENVATLDFDSKCAWIKERYKGGHWVYFKNAKLLQYTGFQDKNGIKIFDGDIIRVNRLTFDSSGPLPENLIIRFYNGMFQLFRGGMCLHGLHLIYIEDGEVIGNVYENADLVAV